MTFEYIGCENNTFLQIILIFNVQGSVHRKYVPFDTFTTRCNVIQSIYFWKTALHVLGWYHHPSSGAHLTLFTVSGTCQTVIDKNKLLTKFI